MSDEQRVRTMAGWIGVEISRSRVRTLGKAGYGLYRVRGSVGHRTRAEMAAIAALRPEGVTEDGQGERGPWTPYAFTLEEIEWSVRAVINDGVPAGPNPLWLMPGDDGEAVTVPTRWTSAYRGRRDLGAGGSPSVDAPLERSTVRSRQRDANAAFQRDHQVRRDHGLKARYAAKEARRKG